MKYSNICELKTVAAHITASIAQEKRIFGRATHAQNVRSRRVTLDRNQV